MTPVRTRLAASVATLLAVQALAGAIAAIVTWRELRLLERFVRQDLERPEPVFAAMSHSRLVGRVGLVSFLIAASTWLVWQHRAHATLRAVGVAELEYRPGRAVAWWFVPIANLWRPFEALRELWKASGPDPRWWETRTWPLLGWWWAAWLSTGFGIPWLLVAFRRTPPFAEPIITADRVVLATNLATVIAGSLAIALVTSIDRRQDRLVAARPLAPPPHPAPGLP